MTRWLLTLIGICVVCFGLGYWAFGLLGTP
jgi:hypothetical protein